MAATTPSGLRCSTNAVTGARRVDYGLERHVVGQVAGEHGPLDELIYRVGDRLSLFGRDEAPDLVGVTRDHVADLSYDRHALGVGQSRPRREGLARRGDRFVDGSAVGSGHRGEDRSVGRVEHLDYAVRCDRSAVDDHLVLVFVSHGNFTFLGVGQSARRLRWSRRERRGLHRPRLTRYFEDARRWLSGNVSGSPVADISR